MSANGRIKLLKAMDEFVRNEIGDEEITCDVWLACGVPDGAKEDDYDDIANDREMYHDVLECFAKCCAYSMVNEE